MDGRNSAAPPEGRSLRNARSVNGTQKQNAFSGALSAIPRPRRFFSPHSFLAKQKRMGRRRHNAPFRRRKDMARGAAEAAPDIRTVLSAHTKHAACWSIPRHSDAEEVTSAEAEEIGREGQNLHDLLKNQHLTDDRKIRMIILSHNRSIGRREKTGRCDGWRKISCLRRSGPIWPRSLTFRR